MHYRNISECQKYMHVSSEMYASQKYMSKIYSGVFGNIPMAEIYYIHDRNAYVYFQNYVTTIV